MNKNNPICTNDNCPMKDMCLRHKSNAMFESAAYEHFEPKADEYGTMQCEHRIVATKLPKKD